MNKKIISSILVIALLNLVGCSSFSTHIKIPDEYIQYEKESGKPNEIYLVTNDNEKYHFTSWNYNIENNIFWGKGFHLINGTEKPINIRIPFTRIRFIQWEEYNERATKKNYELVGVIVLSIFLVMLSGLELQSDSKKIL